jgi:hypothetical protein
LAQHESRRYARARRRKLYATSNWFVVITVGLDFGHLLQSQPLTSAELAKILQIHAWHVPVPPKSKEWIIETVRAGDKANQKLLPTGPILISLRSLANQEYEFALMNKGGDSVGTFRPCAEPKEIAAICDGQFSISFKDAPVCIDDCSSAVLAEFTPDVGDGEKRWIVIKQVKAPAIPVDSKTTASPIR